MLLKAIHSIHTGVKYKPGDYLVVVDEEQAERLIENGAAVPVRKKITLSLETKNIDDDRATELMDDKRKQSNPDKTVIKRRPEGMTAESKAVIAEPGNNSATEFGYQGPLSGMNAEIDEARKQILNRE